MTGNALQGEDDDSSSESIPSGFTFRSQDTEFHWILGDLLEQVITQDMGIALPEIQYDRPDFPPAPGPSTSAPSGGGMDDDRDNDGNGGGGGGDYGADNGGGDEYADENTTENSDRIGGQGAPPACGGGQAVGHQPPLEVFDECSEDMVGPPWDRTKDAVFHAKSLSEETAREKDERRVRTFEAAVRYIWAAYGRREPTFDTRREQDRGSTQNGGRQQGGCWVSLPGRARLRICNELIPSEFRRDKPIRLTRSHLTDFAWTPDSFQTLAPILEAIAPWARANFSLRADLVAAILVLFPIGVTLSPLLPPNSYLNRLATMWLPRFAACAQKIVVEVEACRFEYGPWLYAQGVDTVVLMKREEIMMQTLVDAILEREDGIDLESLVLLCRRYYGQRPVADSEDEWGSFCPDAVIVPIVDPLGTLRTRVRSLRVAGFSANVLRALIEGIFPLPDPMPPGYMEARCFLITPSTAWPRLPGQCSMVELGGGKGLHLDVHDGWHPDPALDAEDVGVRARRGPRMLPAPVVDGDGGAKLPRSELLEQYVEKTESASRPATRGNGESGGETNGDGHKTATRDESGNAQPGGNCRDSSRSPKTSTPKPAQGKMTSPASPFVKWETTSLETRRSEPVLDEMTIRGPLAAGPGQEVGASSLEAAIEVTSKSTAIISTDGADVTDAGKPERILREKRSYVSLIKRKISGTELRSQASSPAPPQPDTGASVTAASTRDEVKTPAPTEPSPAPREKKSYGSLLQRKFPGPDPKARVPMPEPRSDTPADGPGVERAVSPEMVEPRPAIKEKMSLAAHLRKKFSGPDLNVRASSPQLGSETFLAKSADEPEAVAAAKKQLRRSLLGDKRTGTKPKAGSSGPRLRNATPMQGPRDEAEAPTAAAAATAKRKESFVSLLRRKFSGPDLKSEADSPPPGSDTPVDGTHGAGREALRSYRKLTKRPPALSTFRDEEEGGGDTPPAPPLKDNPSVPPGITVETRKSAPLLSVSGGDCSGGGPVRKESSAASALCTGIQQDTWPLPPLPIHSNPRVSSLGPVIRFQDAAHPFKGNRVSSLALDAYTHASGKARAAASTPAGTKEEEAPPPPPSADESSHSVPSIGTLSSAATRPHSPEPSVGPTRTKSSFRNLRGKASLSVLRRKFSSTTLRNRPSGVFQQGGGVPIGQALSVEGAKEEENREEEDREVAVTREGEGERLGSGDGSGAGFGRRRSLRFLQKKAPVSGQAPREEGEENGPVAGTLRKKRSFIFFKGKGE